MLIIYRIRLLDKSHLTQITSTRHQRRVTISYDSNIVIVTRRYCRHRRHIRCRCCYYRYIIVIIIIIIVIEPRRFGGF